MTAASGAREQGTGPSGGPSALVPGMRWRRVFPGEERQLGVLRRWLESLLPDCAARDDVTSVATELGTNAVRHTASGDGGWFAVEVTWHQPAVRVAVADCGSPGGPRVIDDPASEDGRGLLLVRGLSVWWALAGGELVAAPSAQELASLLGRVLDSPPPPPCTPAAGDTASADARTVQAAGVEQQPGVTAPRFPPGHPPGPQSEADGIGLDGHRGPRTPARRYRPSATAGQTNTASGRGRPVAATS